MTIRERETGFNPVGILDLFPTYIRTVRCTKIFVSVLGVAGKCSTSQKSKNEGIEFETTTEGFKTCSLSIVNSFCSPMHAFLLWFSSAFSQSLLIARLHNGGGVVAKRRTCCLLPWCRLLVKFGVSRARLTTALPIPLRAEKFRCH